MPPPIMEWGGWSAWGDLPPACGMDGLVVIGGICPLPPPGVEGLVVIGRFAHPHYVMEGLLVMG